MVVDRDMDVLPSRARAALHPVLEDALPDVPEAPEFLDVEVEQVAGPLMLLWVVFARPSHSTRWFIVSLLVSLLGFGLLVLRQPRHRDPTSGDNGARV